MILIGWDVGIKNLSYCVVEYNEEKKEYKILDWNIIDLRTDGSEEEENIVEDTKKTKAKTKSNAKAKTTSLEDNEQDKQNKEKPKAKAKKTQKCSKISLKDLSRNLYKQLEENNYFSNFDYVIIENQPVLKNPKMKSIQMILYSYFSFKSLNIESFKDLILMNASNKLKVYKGEVDKDEMDKINNLKSKYSRNKKISILHTKLILEQHEFNKNNWINFFDKNKKKDDLADSFLMILYYLKKNKLIK
jgi:hypothetical protein